MKKHAWVVIAIVALVSAAVESQQAPQQPAAGTPTALPSVPAREPAWAFPVQAGQLPAESPEPKSFAELTETAKALLIGKDALTACTRPGPGLARSAAPRCPTSR